MPARRVRSAPATEESFGGGGLASLPSDFTICTDETQQSTQSSPARRNTRRRRHRSFDATQSTPGRGYARSEAESSVHFGQVLAASSQIGGHLDDTYTVDRPRVGAYALNETFNVNEGQDTLSGIIEEFDNEMQNILDQLSSGTTEREEAPQATTSFRPGRDVNRQIDELVNNLNAPDDPEFDDDIQVYLDKLLGDDDTEFESLKRIFLRQTDNLEAEEEPQTTRSLPPGRSVRSRRRRSFEAVQSTPGRGYGRRGRAVGAHAADQCTPSSQAGRHLDDTYTVDRPHVGPYALNETYTCPDPRLNETYTVDRPHVGPYALNETFTLGDEDEDQSSSIESAIASILEDFDNEIQNIMDRLEAAQVVPCPPPQPQVVPCPPPQPQCPPGSPSSPGSSGSSGYAPTQSSTATSSSGYAPPVFAPNMGQVYPPQPCPPAHGTAFWLPMSPPGQQQVQQPQCPPAEAFWVPLSPPGHGHPPVQQYPPAEAFWVPMSPPCQGQPLPVQQQYPPAEAFWVPVTPPGHGQHPPAQQAPPAPPAQPAVPQGPPAQPEPHPNVAHLSRADINMSLYTGIPVRPAPGRQRQFGTPAGTHLVLPTMEGILRMIDVGSEAVTERCHRTQEIRNLLTQMRGTHEDSLCRLTEFRGMVHNLLGGYLRRATDRWFAMSCTYAAALRMADNQEFPYPRLQGINHSEWITHEEYSEMLRRAAVISRIIEREIFMDAAHLGQLADIFDDAVYNFQLCFNFVPRFLCYIDNVFERNDTIRRHLVFFQEEVDHFMAEWRRGGPALNEPAVDEQFRESCAPQFNELVTPPAIEGDMSWSSGTPTPPPSPARSPPLSPCTPVSPQRTSANVRQWMHDASPSRQPPQNIAYLEQVFTDYGQIEGQAANEVQNTSNESQALDDSVNSIEP